RERRFVDHARCGIRRARTKERSTLVVSQRPEDISGQHTGTAGSRPNRIRGRQRGWNSTTATSTSLETKRRDNECDAGGVGISGRKLQRCCSTFRGGRRAA